MNNNSSFARWIDRCYDGRYQWHISDGDVVQLRTAAQPHNLRLGFIQSQTAGFHPETRAAAAAASLAGLLTYSRLCDNIDLPSTTLL